MSANLKLSDQDFLRDDYCPFPPSYKEYVDGLVKKYLDAIDENIALKYKISRMEFELEMHNISKDFY